MEQNYKTSKVFRFTEYDAARDMLSNSGFRKEHNIPAKEIPTSKVRARIRKREDGYDLVILKRLPKAEKAKLEEDQEEVAES